MHKKNEESRKQEVGRGGRDKRYQNGRGGRQRGRVRNRQELLEWEGRKTEMEGKEGK